MKALLLASSWFFFSAGVILAGVATVNYTVYSPTPEDTYLETVKISSAQSPGSPNLTAEAVAEGEVADARVILVQNFLERHNSPLAEEDNFGQVLVDLADEHNVDFRLLPSIA
ncbi:MAG: hypothetical protein QG639_58, partial [Patescibacteria group bacterium]|nr:hypothetical protein [Patescibacteria group bacterium]